MWFNDWNNLLNYILLEMVNLAVYVFFYFIRKREFDSTSRACLGTYQYPELDRMLKIRQGGTFFVSVQPIITNCWSAYPVLGYPRGIQRSCYVWFSKSINSQLAVFFFKWKNPFNILYKNNILYIFFSEKMYKAKMVLI